MILRTCINVEVREPTILKFRQNFILSKDWDGIIYSLLTVWYRMTNRLIQFYILYVELLPWRSDICGTSDTEVFKLKTMVHPWTLIQGSFNELHLWFNNGYFKNLKTFFVREFLFILEAIYKIILNHNTQFS